MTEVFAKSSTHPAGRLRLRNEVVRLRQAQHPAVVQVADFDDGEDRTRLELVRAATTTIAESPPEFPELALAFIASTARAVADLHEIGIAHRRLTGDHILVTADGHPMLCGFADAVIPAGSDDQVTDQRSLGALIDMLAQSASSAGRHGRAAKCLRSLAVEVAQSNGEMTAATIAARAAKLAGRHRLTAVSTPQSNRAATWTDTGPPTWLKPTAAAVLFMVMIAVAMFAFGGRTSSHDGQLGEATARSPKTAMSAAPATTAQHDADDATAATPPTSAKPAVQFEAGGAVFAAGEPGDEVFVGNWTCDGDPSAVLWRPDTGDVFVFPALPGPDSEATGKWAAGVPGGSIVLPDDLGVACPQLVVRDARGVEQTVALP